MASVVDIPTHLLNIESKEDFLAWVKNLPCETWIRRSLVMAWAKYLGTTLTGQDYIKAGM